MRVIVCGSAPRVNPERPGWTDRTLMTAALSDLDSLAGPLTILHGGALGADALADEWARDRGRVVELFEANWSRGRSAGPARNRRMLAASPALVMAFSLNWPMTGGTAHMTGIAYQAHVPVEVWTPDGERRTLRRRSDVTA